MELLLTDSGELSKLQVGEIQCSSKSARIQPSNVRQLQLITLGRLAVGENQSAWFLTWAAVHGSCLFWLCVYLCGFFRTISWIFFSSFFFLLYFQKSINLGQELQPAMQLTDEHCSCEISEMFIYGIIGGSISLRFSVSTLQVFLTCKCQCGHTFNIWLCLGVYG